MTVLTKKQTENVQQREDTVYSPAEAALLGTARCAACLHCNHLASNRDQHVCLCQHARCGVCLTAPPRPGTAEASAVAVCTFCALLRLRQAIVMGY